MIKEVEKAKKSLTQRARDEVQEEFEKEAVKTLKVKLKELHKAETIVENLKREIADLEESIEQGNLP